MLCNHLFWRSIYASENFFFLNLVFFPYKNYVHSLYCFMFWNLDIVRFAYVIQWQFMMQCFTGVSLMTLIKVHVSWPGTLTKKSVLKSQGHLVVGVLGGGSQWQVDSFWPKLSITIFLLSALLTYGIKFFEGVSYFYLYRIACVGFIYLFKICDGSLWCKIKKDIFYFYIYEV